MKQEKAELEFYKTILEKVSFDRKLFEKEFNYNLNFILV